jgi:hypothetical protein
MTQEESSNLVAKTVRGILTVLIPMLLIGWGGNYVMVRVAITQHEQMIDRNAASINQNKKDIYDLEIADEKIWQWLLEYNTWQTEREEKD